MTEDDTFKRLKRPSMEILLNRWYRGDTEGITITDKMFFFRDYAIHHGYTEKEIDLYFHRYD